jgi:beta-lactamase regulating signal transducer with metallopeptidase domain
MNAILSEFSRLAFHQLWQVTAVILILGPLILIACRRRPHLAYVLWLVVLLKCLAPPIWSSPTGVFSWIAAQRAPQTVAAAPPSTLETREANSEEPPAVQPESPEPAAAHVQPVATSVPSAAHDAADAVQSPFASSIGAGEVLVIAWFCGVMALGGLLLGRWSYYFVLLRHVSVETDDDVRKLVARLARQLGLRRRVEVVVTTRPFGPAVYGLWRPTLILPQALLKTDSPDHLRRIIAHELIHVRRFDNFVSTLQLLVQILWWFHPLVWWMNRRICREREYCCDEEVVAGLNCKPDTYAQSLLDVLKLKRQLRPALLPGVDAVEITEKRLEKIMDSKRQFHSRMPRAGWIVLVAGILVIMPGAGFILPAGDAASPYAATADDTPAKSDAAADEIARPTPPAIVETSPQVGAKDVDPSTDEITVTFDRDMSGGFSWTGGGPDYPPGAEGKKPFWRDKRTCVMPVKLKEGKYYRVGINSKSYQHFASVEGMPAQPSAIYFTTKGADKEVVEQTKVPQVVKMDPSNEATDVDPSIEELRVTFNVPMGGGFSWTGGGPRHPDGREGKRPYWTKDRKTCVLPVTLKPDWHYRLGLNSPSHKNFQSAAGVPLDPPVIYSFTTGSIGKKAPENGKKNAEKNEKTDAAGKHGWLGVPGPDGIVKISAGVLRAPIVMEKPLVLQGEDRDKCVLELTANSPAILVTSKQPAVIDSVTIKWQLESDEATKDPVAAIAVKNGNLTLRNCRIVAPANFKRCPAAVYASGFSKVQLENCTFEGFEFCINYTGGAEGAIRDCRVLNPGHCGITVFSGSKIEVARTIITGSAYHGLRCTGGTLLAHDNLIVKNKNRGIYLGNKPGNGKIENNLIVENGTGISAFGQTEFTIANNVIVNSSFSAVDSRSTCPITVKNNIFQDNANGFVLFAEGKNLVKLEQNTFWRNQKDAENVELPKNSLLVDPQFEAPDQGNFAAIAEDVIAAKQGLTDPEVFVKLWEQWKSVSAEN